MKKALALLLAMVMVVGTFAACGGGEGEGSGSGDQSGKTITIGIQQSPMVEDYETNGLTKWLEEQTGLNIEFELFSAQSADANSQLSTRMASGEKLPDILWSFGLSSTLYKQYGDDGYLLDLAPYYEDEEKSANFWSQFHRLPEDDQEDYMRAMYDEDGHAYGYPHLEWTTVDTEDFAVYINRTWLDQLGLQVPTNKDELYSVLKAFKEGDPNGNGIADEIPLIGSQGSLSADVVNWIVNMFCYATDAYYFNVDENGQLYLPFISDEYREALKFMDKLVKEGLMSTLCWTAGNTQLQQITTPSSGTLLAGIFVGHLTLCVENYNELLYNYEAMPYFSGVIRNHVKYSFGSHITTDCEDPDAAWSVFNALATVEGSYRARYGEKGVDWTDADPGTKSFCGLDAEIKVINEAAFFSNTTTTYNSVGPTILIWSEGEVIQYDESMGEWALRKREMMTDNYNYFMEQEEKTEKKTCGIIVYTEEEKTSTEMTRSNCASLITTTRSKFCTGAKDPNSDAEWNEYLSELETNGLQEWINVAQTAYTRGKNNVKTTN